MSVALSDTWLRRLHARISARLARRSERWLNNRYGKPRLELLPGHVVWVRSANGYLVQCKVVSVDPGARTFQLINVRTYRVSTVSALQIARGYAVRR